jgi:hypothetical protein
LSLEKVPEWKILSASNAERSFLKARSRRQAVQFVRMNGNLFVTLARNGLRSNGWRLIITTASKKKRHASWESAPNQNLQ